MNINLLRTIVYLSPITMFRDDRTSDVDFKLLKRIVYSNMIEDNKKKYYHVHRSD